MVGLAFGIVGAFAYDHLGSSAGAAPGTATRQDVLSLLADAGTNLSGPPAGTWIEIDTPGNIRLPLDASHYPANTTFRLELAGTYGGSFPALTVCLRLSDIVSGAIAGSEACVAPSSGAFSVSSATFTLPAGAHTYKLEISGESTLVTTGARVVAEWTERR